MRLHRHVGGERDPLLEELLEERSQVALVAGRQRDFLDVDDILRATVKEALVFDVGEDVAGQSIAVEQPEAEVADQVLFGVAQYLADLRGGLPQCAGEQLVLQAGDPACICRAERGEMDGMARGGAGGAASGGARRGCAVLRSGPGGGRLAGCAGGHVEDRCSRCSGCGDYRTGRRCGRGSRSTFCRPAAAALQFYISCRGSKSVTTVSLTSEKWFAKKSPAPHDYVQDKGKPVERRGRKATGLREVERRPTTAGLPGTALPPRYQ